MLTALFVQATIMSAALGITSPNPHLPHLSNSHDADNAISSLETLLQQMYVNNSKCYESNITEILGPQYEDLLKKPLLELLKGKKEEISGKRAQKDSEKNPLLMTFTTNTSAKLVDTGDKDVSLSHYLDQNATDSESDLVLENDEELQPIKSKATLNESVNENGKENKENLNETFTENLENSKEHPTEKLKENLKENSKVKIEEEQTESYGGSSKNISHKFKNNQEDNWQENYMDTSNKNLEESEDPGKVKENHIPKKNNFTQQKLNDLAELEQVLRYFTQLIKQQPGFISNAKSAITNSTSDTATSNMTSKENERTLQGPLDVTKFLPSTNLKANLTEILNHVTANISDLNWYKPESKNLSRFRQNSSGAFQNENFSDSITTDQNIELFQNFFSYRKIPYPVMSIHPLLANWTQGVSSNNSATHCGKTKPKHSWMHSGSSNSSFHIKHSLKDPITRAQIKLEKPANSKTVNESCLFTTTATCFNVSTATQESKTSASPSTVAKISKITAAHSELMKVPPLPDFDNRFALNPAEMLQKCWVELNKTKSEIRQRERQKPDAITCIIPRQNTSIFYGHMLEPVSTKSNSFIKFFNRKEKKEKKKKVNTGRSTTAYFTMDTKVHTKPTTTSRTHKVQHEPNQKNDHDRDKENELQDVDLGKVFEDISSRMCLPDIMNRLLELVCQNGTKSSLTSTHSGMAILGNSLLALSKDHRNQNRNHDHNHTFSATRLGGNDYKTRQADRNYKKTKLTNNSRLKNYLPMNYRDKNSNQIDHQKLKSESNEDIRNLSNLLFFVGMNKDKNSREKDVSNNSPLEKTNIDLAYMTPLI